VSRFEGPPEATAQEIPQNASRFSRMTTRLRARRLQREAENPTSITSSAPGSGGQPGNHTSDLPRRTLSPFPSEGMDLLRHFDFDLDDSERFVTAFSELRRIARPSHYGASTSSNPPNPEPADGTHIVTGLAADQASNSSTMAVIQEDVAFTESAGEPSNAGSSRSLRRRRASDALGSLDVDGGDLHQNKRRRLN
jgi:E3 ubiquitin-protein ligase RNF5